MEKTQSTCFSLPVYPPERGVYQKTAEAWALVINLPINESFTQLTQISQIKQKHMKNSLVGMKVIQIFEMHARPGIRDM